jgi:hypothetical protein
MHFFFMFAADALRENPLVRKHASRGLTPMCAQTLAALTVTGRELFGLENVERVIVLCASVGCFFLTPLNHVARITRSCQRDIVEKPIISDLKR